MDRIPKVRGPRAPSIPRHAPDVPAAPRDCPLEGLRRSRYPTASHAESAIYPQGNDKAAHCIIYRPRVPAGVPNRRQGSWRRKGARALGAPQLGCKLRKQPLFSGRVRNTCNAHLL